VIFVPVLILTKGCAVSCIPAAPIYGFLLAIFALKYLKDKKIEFYCLKSS